MRTIRRALWLLPLSALLPVAAPAQGAAAEGAVACSAEDRSLGRADIFSAADIGRVAECASQGDVVAMNEMGRRYGTGRGVAVDAVKSFEFYRAAALAGYPQAKANLAFMYYNGEGTEQDYAEALRWNLEAAGEGSDQAQYAVGYVYATGIGGEKNGPEAERWFLAAARQGYLPAQQALIRVYSEGDLVPRNRREAAVWTHRVRDAQLYGSIWREPGA